MAVGLWVVSSILLIYSVSGLLQFSKSGVLVRLSIFQELEELKKVGLVLTELQGILEAGSVPESLHWQKLATLKNPWQNLIEVSVAELRSRGAPLIPTLKRIRAVAEQNLQLLLQAKSKAAPAYSQAGVCTVMIPVFGVGLYWLLPSLQNSLRVWIAANTLALACGLNASLWILKMIDSARWGGLAKEKRDWLIAAFCGGERFLALIRSGLPGDLAWTQMVQSLPDALALEWGHSVWQNFSSVAQPKANPASQALVQCGRSIRTAVQIGVMEGRACQERVESILLGAHTELKACINTELERLATRVLLPLFIFVAPAILGLLSVAMYLFWVQIKQGAL